VNLGTPDTPETGDVRKYLREFLMDKRVIDMPVTQRFFLINGIIAPFRAPKSAKVYKQLWDERGSPLLYYGIDLKNLLQQQLGSKYHVALGMRYQSPSIKSALEELRSKFVDRIIVLPLFPQYASASTGSVQDKVMEIVKDWWIVPDITFISSFCDDPLFIKAFAALGHKYLEKEPYDHVVFSYHGIPERHVLKGSVNNYCKLGTCCNTYHKMNRYCYRAQCFETSRLLAKELNITEDQYSVTFQSRLGKDPWLKPYTDELLKELPAQGKKRVLAFSPAFVADCLETTIEVGCEFKEMFEQAGGEHWQLVESLNTSPLWVEAVKQMILRN
ncbi:MAG: ferrochelatase, partial [Bacteroidota bacterium]|nr:ferrochelatase [Bacteroidota bacterium]